MVITCKERAFVSGLFSASANSSQYSFPKAASLKGTDGEMEPSPSSVCYHGRFERSGIDRRRME